MSFSNNSSDRGRGRTNRDSGRSQMHNATCSKCGKPCLVPFKPTGNRPIFCSDCFRTEGGANSRRNDERSSRMSSDRPMFDAICDKCGNRCQIPFPPRPGRKVYCSHCFEQVDKDEKGSTATPHLQEQLDAINIKLGKILQLLSTRTTNTTKPEEVTLKTEKPSEIVVTKEITNPEKKELKAAPVKKKAASKKKPSTKTD